MSEHGHEAPSSHDAPSMDHGKHDGKKHKGGPHGEASVAGRELVDDIVEGPVSDLAETAGAPFNLVDGLTRMLFRLPPREKSKKEKPAGDGHH